MIRSLNELSGYTVRGTDGEIGRVDASYFDDDRWVVRYFIVDSGDWLQGRHFLLSSRALGTPDADGRVIPADLTRERVENSPVYVPGQPLSRQQEIEVHTYYDWPFYWVPTVSGLGPGNPLASYPLIELGEQMEENELGPEGETKNLHSTRDVFGYSIQARDGEIGALDDFIVDDEDWRILYLIVNTGGWLSNRKVLISPTWVETVQWANSRVVVDLKRETIESSPEYDPNVPLDRGYETRLYDHYGRQDYWSMDGVQVKEENQEPGMPGGETKTPPTQK